MSWGADELDKLEFEDLSGEEAAFVGSWFGTKLQDEDGLTC